MAASGEFLLLLLTSIVISITTTASASANPPSAASSQMPRTYSPALFATILSTLGFQSLSNATANASLSISTPITIFAPTDSSLLTCPSCSIPLLLQEHSVPGLYNLHFLRTLAFGTKIHSYAPNRCLTVTASPLSPSAAISTRKVFINGVEITKPDLFNNGLVVIHGLQGFMTHLSPLSCSIESMTSLAFPSHPLPTAAFFIMRLMLKEAMMRLRVSEYSLLALAMRVKYPELSELKALTVFAMDDASIFAGRGGQAYVSDLMFHIVPNMLLMGSDLMGLPLGTALPTMQRGQKLVVTTAGGGGPLEPMRINFVKIKTFDMVYNKRIVVHGLSAPFPRVYHPTVEEGHWQNEGPRSSYSQNGAVPETAVTASPTESTVGTLASENSFSAWKSDSL